MTYCSAPGKVMLAGEYAVIDGSPAVLLAIGRRATARLNPAPHLLSPFTAAARALVSEHFGENSSEAKAASRVEVDTSRFRAHGEKLGMGSSAAATVAAVGAALGAAASTATPLALDIDLVFALARRAHGDAQQASGSRGSGADVATCCYGGCLLFSPSVVAPDAQPKIAPLALPTDLHLVFPWCGQVASTTALVPQVRSLRASEPSAYAKRTRAIADSAVALGCAASATEAIAALRAGGQAVAALGRDAKAPLWLPIHSQMLAIAEDLGGTLKPTGAGGGDLALGAFASDEQARRFMQRLQSLGIYCPSLAGTKEGVRLHSQTSKVGE